MKPVRESVTLLQCIRSSAWHYASSRAPISVMQDLLTRNLDFFVFMDRRLGIRDFSFNLKLFKWRILVIF